MTRKSTTTDIATETRSEAAETVSPASTEQEILQKLDVLIGYLHAMNKRDRMRYYGALMHSVIAFVPMALFLLSAWYIYENGDELLSKIVGETVNRIMPSPDFMKNIQFGR